MLQNNDSMPQNMPQNNVLRHIKVYRIKVQAKSQNIWSYIACSSCGKKTEQTLNETFECASCNSNGKVISR
ncbi:hypothetical protein AXF42_Ash011461 [Apostasia shenzhenica]|uniref:Replication factor A C-terminal domain-containing protein n=1 Tax=Apostasia shenzhenica TaxID=1088818 RepID=A0A2I0BAS1_9ASPA|nr:hypothetical protein AXF42_Ash011461 [Apostasia shenzhenica]